MVSLKDAKSLSCPAPIQLVQKDRQFSPKYPDKWLSILWGQFRWSLRSLNWSDNHSVRDTQGPLTTRAQQFSGLCVGGRSGLQLSGSSNDAARQAPVKSGWWQWRLRTFTWGRASAQPFGWKRTRKAERVSTWPKTEKTAVIHIQKCKGCGDLGG